VNRVRAFHALTAVVALVALVLQLVQVVKGSVVVLVDADPPGLADRMLHLVVPVLAVLGWLVLGPRPRIDWGVCLRTALWPLAWLVMILGQAAATGWYPYPFLDHGRHGWGSVLAVCAGILVLFFVVFAILRECDRRMRPAPAAPATAALTGS
jgi:hypothetical protein